MVITKKSMYTQKSNTMDLDVTQEQIDEYNGPRHIRRLIQHIFPQLNPDEREFLISGATPEEWEDIFGKQEE